MENVLNTSIKKLDEILEGGIRKGSKVCVLCEADTPYRVFIGQLVVSFAEMGTRVVFFSTDLPPSSWYELKEEYFACSKCEENVVMVDAYSYKIGSKGEHKYRLERGDENEFLEIIKKILQEEHEIGVVFISLSELEDKFGLDNAFSILEQIQKKTNLTTIVSHAIEWIKDEEYEKKLLRNFDCLIAVRNLKLRYMLLPYFRVLKASWVPRMDGQKITFKIGLGGVKPFIPKILVTGPFNAGKSSFIRSASDRSAHADELSTTVAMDFGKKLISGLEVRFYGTPGQRRFDPILKELGSSALGVVLVIDSTDPKSFERAVEMVEKCKVGVEGWSIPIIIVANKQNLKGAISINEIKDRFNKLGVDAEIVPVRAEKGWPKKGYSYCLLRREDVNKVIDRLVSSMKLD